MQKTITMATFGSPSQLFIIFLLIILIFGTKKLRSLGSDLGESLKNFKKAMSDDHNQTDDNSKVEKRFHDVDFKSKNITDEMIITQSKEIIKSKEN
ncbi:MAG: twin-arginine translocase TatA/TatE family subunit, partial [Arsenophonus sp. ET-DL12-MAG3]